MKKLISLALLIALLTLSLALLSFPGAAASSSVTVSGNDLASALNSVADGGTITISGTVTVASDFTWPTYDKDVTITGGTLNLTSKGGTVNINGNVTFDNMTLTMTADATVYANGHSVTVRENVTVTNSVTAIYGGGNGTTVTSTDMTLLSGDYKTIYGGSNKGTVTGDTHLTVGGTVNAACDWTSHTGTYKIFGGGNNDAIGGDVYFTFTGSAEANYIYGGSNGSSAKITGNKYATMSGGSTMSFYGGNVDVDTGKDNYTVLSGGTLQQLLGANSGANMTGNVDLRVIGGTVQRRIYGGCYNEWDYGWQSSYYVKGNIKLVIGGGVSITYSVSDNDRGVFAHSRQRSLSSTEITSLVFADATAYNNYKNKIGQQDTLGKWLIMGSTSAADDIHYYTYAASGASLTETCAYHSSYSATATLELDSAASLVYNGSTITPTKVTYGAGFEGDPFEITYADNVNVGTATASMTRNGVTASLDFTIEKAAQAAPTGLTKTNETIAGKADGTISDLTTAMEIGTDRTTYTAVTDPDMTFAAGTYYVRYTETDNYKASDPISVSIAAGRQLTVTFLADGTTVATKYVDYNGTLTDIPAIPTKEGYDRTAPEWEAIDLTGITTDLTVNAVYTVNQYTVTFKIDGEIYETKSIAHGTALTDIPTPPAREGYNGKWESADLTAVTSDMTVNAVYTVKTYTVIFVIDGEEIKVVAVNHGAAVQSIPTIPTKEGHDRTTPYWDTALTSVTSDLRVNAVYVPNVYTVTFTVDGETYTTGSVTHGESLTDIPAVPDKEGCNGKWNTTNFSTVTGDMTVNAVYTAKKYTVIFVVDGKSTIKSVSHGTKLSEIAGLPALPHKVGYDQTPPTWSLSTDTVVTSGLTVTAVYTPNTYTITFKDGDTVVDTKTVTHGESLADIPAVPTKEGHDSAWDTANFDTVTGDMTVLAVHTVKTYTVTFKDGDTVVDSLTVNHGEGVTALPTVPVKAGHTSAWEAVDLTAVTADMTVNAIHTPKVYTVTFKDGDTVVATKTVAHGESLSDIPAVPAKEGYVSAWNTANFDTVTGDMTVLAVHTVKTYTVTFVADGTVIATVTVNHGEALAGTHIPPEKDGHAAEWDAEIPATITADLTLNAVYTPITPEPDAGNGQQPDGDGNEAVNGDSNSSTGSGSTDGTNSGAPQDGADTEESGSVAVNIIVVVAVVLAGGVTAVVILKKKGKKNA